MPSVFHSCIFILLKNGFDNIKGGLNAKAVITIMAIYIAISVFVLNSNIEVVNKETVKLDILLAVILNLLLLVTVLNFKEGTKKITIFVRKHYMQLISFTMIILNTINLIYNANYSMKIIARDTEILNQDAYGTITNVCGEIINNLKEYDKSLYRMENKFTSASNGALVYGFNGVNYSGSTYSETLHSFLEKLGIRKSHVLIGYNMENTKAVDMLLGIKYLILPPNKIMYKDYPIEYEELYIENNARIYKNPYCLSLGYVVNKNIFNTNMDNYNTFTLQNEILKNMTGIDEEVYKEYTGEVIETIEGMEKNGIECRNLQENAKITYEVTTQSTDNIYMYIVANSGTGILVYINGEEVAPHQSLTNNEMINIGKREIGEKVKIEIIPYDDINIEGYFVYYEDEEVLQKHYQKLSEKQVDMEKVSDSKYKGTINVNEDKETVLFTIPYDEGWKVTVDGKEVQYEKALDSLIAIELSKGNHEIVFEFMPRGIILGGILTSFGVILLIIIMSKKNKNK